MNGTCEYVLDGHDTDGTPWFRCSTHDGLVFGSIGDDSPESVAHVYCDGYEPIPYEYRELERKLDPRRFTAMSGKLAGLLAHILGTDRWTTEPQIVEACYDSRGNIMVRHEGEVGMSWFGGSADELASNLTRLFRVAELTPAERTLFHKLGRQRVYDWRRTTKEVQA